MLRILALFSVVAADLSLPINDRIKNFREKRFVKGSFEEAERAKSWSHRVYLATFPRSGNHWMRYLLEEATGIVTSSVYTDCCVPHLSTPFPWGAYCCDHGYEGRSRYPDQGEIFVVKTHFPSNCRSWFDRLPYSKAVRIIRHPVDSFYSFYLLKQSLDGKSAEYWMPKEELKNLIRRWRRFQEFWDFEDCVFTIRYEDLYLDPLANLTKVLAHMGYCISQDDIKRAVEKYPPVGGLFKHFHHFTREDLALIQSELGDLIELYGYEAELMKGN